MTISIPDTITQRVGLTEEEILLRIAVELFREERITLGQASEIANLHQAEFQKELARRQIPIHYGIEELEADLTTIDRLNLAD